jgi:hypothetical protein
MTPPSMVRTTEAGMADEDRARDAGLGEVGGPRLWRRCSWRPSPWRSRGRAMGLGATSATTGGAGREGAP